MLSLGYCILGVMLCITTFFLAKNTPTAFRTDLFWSWPSFFFSKASLV